MAWNVYVLNPNGPVFFELRHMREFEALRREKIAAGRRSQMFSM